MLFINVISFIIIFQPMETEAHTPFRPRTSKSTGFIPPPEVELYFHLLVLIHLIDTKRYTEVRCEN